jgi:anti-sigma regulatory factor (Ser/Thr protein kinase)
LLIPSLPDWIGPTVDYLCQRAVLGGACSATRSGKLMVALHEALANSVIHGNLEVSSHLKETGDDAFARALAERAADQTYAERGVDIRVDYDGESCRWTITDQGRGFDVDKILARTQSDDPEVVLSSGRGILMMRSFLDEVRYELGGRQLHLRLQRESGQERRINARVPIHQTVKITPLAPDGSAGQAYEALLRNLSEGGAAFLQDRLAPSQRILIGLWAQGRWVHVPAEVRHVQGRAEDLVELGCRFLSAEQMQTEEPAASAEDQERVHEAIEALMAAHRSEPLPGHDRRLHQRVVFTETIQVQTTAEGTGIPGYARDLSKGGMAFITTAPVPLEVTLVVLPRAGGELRLRSRVVRCHEVKQGYYDVGVKFLQVAQVS